jgi:ribosome recycling factor
MLNDVLADMKSRMDKAIESYRHELMTVRTGRASPALVDRLSIDYYGVPTPLQQLATITVPEAQQILIRPYSPSDLGMIEKAIAKSDIGLTPNTDGQQIRLNLPPLTEERRRDLTKLVAKRAEEARIAIRNIRRDGIQDLRDFEKEGLISEDDLKRGQELIQERTDEHIKLIDDLMREKDAEIMKV